MGANNLTGMLEVSTREQALRWHLQSNCFPPVSLDFIGIAEQAIANAFDGEWDTEILMPNGRTLTVLAIVEGLHLEPFLTDEPYYEDEYGDFFVGDSDEDVE